MIDLNSATLTEIKRILYQHVPECRIWAFGSRVDKQKHHPNADLDLTLECPENQIPDWEQMEHLRQAFSESDIPILVDISLWDDLPPALQHYIRSHGEEISLVNHTREAGFTIVQAIFVLVVLGMLGAYMVTMSTVQQATSTQALMQARAYQAARAGLEWGMAKVNNAAENARAEGEDIIEAANNTCSLFKTGEKIDDMAGFEGEALVTCSLLDNPKEANSTYGIYNIKSKSAYPNVGAIENPDYVSRRLEVTMMVKDDE